MAVKSVGRFRDMASEANDNVKKAMDAAREQELAAYIMRDVDLRQQNAQGKY